VLRPGWGGLAVRRGVRRKKKWRRKRKKKMV
jgi:hypothetical protein